jgi:hypothetical protein
MASLGKTPVHTRMARDPPRPSWQGARESRGRPLGATESGAYHPGVAITTRVARELGTSVEALFCESDDEASTLVEASWFDDERRRTAASQARARILARKVLSGKKRE